jgi:CheY-like chemotaxis protein
MADILVIEDDIDMLALYKHILSKRGRTIHTLSDGDSAIAELQHAAYKPDLVFVDIHLKNGLSGFGVIEHLRQEISLRDVPIVIVTANDMVRDYARRKGVDYFLTKPVDIDTIEQIADRVCM